MSLTEESLATYLLIPGAGGDAWYWHRLIPELARRGHTGVAVDLPADDPTAGLGRYADVVVEAGRGKGQLVVVAQSLAGFTAPLVCDRLPVRELVLVNAMIPQPGETPASWWAATGHEMPTDFDITYHFFHDVPEEVKAVGRAGGKEQSDRPFADPWPLATWPAVTTRVVVSDDDRFFPPDFQIRVARERLGVEPETMPGGHLVACSAGPPPSPTCSSADRATWACRTGARQQREDGSRNGASTTTEIGEGDASGLATHPTGGGPIGRSNLTTAWASTATPPPGSPAGRPSRRRASS